MGFIREGLLSEGYLRLRFIIRGGLFFGGLLSGRLKLIQYWNFYGIIAKAVMNLRNHIDGGYPVLKFCEYNGRISTRYLVWAKTKLRLMEKNARDEVTWHHFTALKWYYITSRVAISQIKCKHSDTNGYATSSDKYQTPHDEAFRSNLSCWNCRGQRQTFHVLWANSAQEIGLKLFLRH